MLRQEGLERHVAEVLIERRVDDRQRLRIEAEQLIVDTLRKNHIDHEEYPAASLIEEGCVHMLGDLFNAPDPAEVVGVGTIGSSEAIMLAGLAAKWRWRQRRAAAGKPADRPNLVMASTVQVVWEKFARYFDVEPRYVPVTAERTTLAPDEAARAVDENTIALVTILGSTYTGEFEPVEPRETAKLIMHSLVVFTHPMMISQCLDEGHDLEAEARASVRFILRAITPR